MSTRRSGVLSARSERAQRARRVTAMLAVLAMAAGTTPARAAPPIADPGAGASKPTVDRTPSGVPLIQITNPSAGGVSRNKFTQFDVDPGGVILNNGTGISSTRLAGYVPPNPNLTQSASVILNEVTGAMPSLLAGYLEVAGSKAEVVIANQNGITCNGCGFINVSRGTLTTGAPVFGGSGTLDAYRVLGGNISIEGGGLEAGSVDQVDLLSRTLSVNAGIWAQRIEVVTGANKIFRDDLTPVPLTPGDPPPSVSLDVGALGGMYAGKIRLVGTERGVGVASAGKLASTGEFTLQADGRIVLGGETTAGGAMTVSAGGDLQNGGTLYGGAALDVTAGGGVTNTGLLAAQDRLTISAARVTTSGTLAAGVTRAEELTSVGELAITASGALSAAGGKLLSGGTLLASGSDLDLTGATVQGSGDVTLSASRDALAAGARLESGGALLAVTGGGFSGRGATLLGQSVQVAGAGVDLGGGATVSAVGDLALDADSYLLVTDSTLRTRGLVSLTTRGLLDATGADATAQAAALAGTTLLADHGTLRTSGDQQLTATAGLLGLYGTTLQAGGAIIAAARDRLDAGSSSITGAAITLGGGNLRLADAMLRSPGDVLLGASSGDIDTARVDLAAGGALVAEASGRFDNSGGSIQANEVRITADVIRSAGEGASRCAASVAAGASACIVSQQDMFLFANSAFQNENGSVLSAGRDLIIARLGSGGALENVPRFVNDVDSTLYVVRNASVLTTGSPWQSHAPYTVAPVTGVSVVVTDPPSATPTLQFTVPGGGIFHVNPDPGHPLIETDPRFTDFRTFLTSEYMLSRLPTSPESSLKRLGDGYYEQQLVLDQIALLTGRRLLLGYGDGEAQYQALMDQGIQVARSLQLTVGVELTDAQVARLTAPIVWMVKVNVGGTDVLVPKVYIPAAQAVALADRGAIVAGGDLTFATRDHVDLNRNLRAGGNVAVSAGSVSIGPAGYTAAKDLQVVTERDITLDAGAVDAGGNLTLLSRGGDVVSTPRTQETLLYLKDGGTQRDVTVQGASVSAGGDVTIAAQREGGGGTGSVRLTATSVTSRGGSITLLADRDVELLAAKEQHTTNAAAETPTTNAFGAPKYSDQVIADLAAGDGKVGRVTAETVTQHVTSLSAASGNVQISAGNDARLAGTTVDAGGDILVRADRNVSMTAVNDSVTKESGTLGRKYERSTDETSRGATLTAGGSATIAAMGTAPDGGDGTGKVRMEGASVTANGGAVTVYGQDVYVGVAREEHDSLKTDESHKSGFLSSKDTYTRDLVKQDLARGTLLSGASNVVVKSEGNLTLEGTQAVGGGDVLVQAGKELNIVAAQDHIVESHLKVVSKGGLLGLSTSGIGITIGDQTTTTQTDIDAIAHQSATVGSVEGGLTVDAQGAVTILGSNLASKEAMSISGSSVTIGSVYDTQTVDSVVTVVTDGLSIGINNGAISAARGAYDAAKRADEVKDDRLKALYALRAAREANELRKAMSSSGGGGDNRSLSVEVGMTHSESRTETRTESRTALGSSLVGEGAISVVARGDPGQGQGDLTIIGSTIQGNDVTLDAARNLSILSAENRIDESTDSLAWSATVGVSARGGKGGNAIGFTARGSVSTSDVDSHDVTHTESQITAAGTLRLKSGGDTTVRGGIVKGDTLLAAVGGNLYLESEQDTSTYHSTDLSLSVQGTYGYGWSASATAGYAGMESSYKSVQQQTGLFAGKGGYDITVGGNTDLEGAVIASEADAAKNRLDTGSLTYSNIENESKYSAVSGSVTVTIGTGGGVSGSGGVPIQGDKKSTTYAAISPGTIITRNGEQDLSGLSRDTANATNAIANIFDKASVEEKKELVDVFGQEAYKAVGDLAKHYTQPYDDAQLQEKRAQQFKDLLANRDNLSEEDRRALDGFLQQGFTEDTANRMIEDAEATKARYQEQYDTWKDGSAVKTALHGLVGAVQTALAGGSALGGGVAAATSEALSSYTKDLPPEQQKLASLVIGAAAARLASAGALNALSGGATAVYGNEYNRQLHVAEVDILKQLSQRWKEFGFTSQEAALAYLYVAACNMVRCGTEMTEDNPLRAKMLATSQAGEEMYYAKLMLQSVAEQIQRESDRAQLDAIEARGGGNLYRGFQPAPLLFQPDPVNDWLGRNVVGTRVGGALQFVGGTLEMAGGIAAAPSCATIVGCAVAAGATVHGFDVAYTGWQTLIDGKRYDTSFSRLLQQAGLPPEIANGLDMAAGLGFSLATAPALAAGRVRLPELEGSGSADDLLRGTLKGDVDGPLPGLCFAAGTQVHGARGLVPIESVQLGDRVLTGGGVEPTESASEHADLRRVVLRLATNDGRGEVQVAVLRPAEWVRQHGALAGAWIPFALPEMGVEGMAHVEEVAAGPRLASGPGRLVLATVASLSDQVVDVLVSGEDEPLRATAGHRLYSRDRGAWVEAGTLRRGEHLATAHGSGEVVEVRAHPGRERVFNIEVETSHSYLVGSSGILSHNENPCARPTWRQSELDVGETLGQGARPQVAFKGGVEVPSTTPGSVRPDWCVGTTCVVEVKNYNIQTNSDGLVRNVSGQAVERSAELPSGFTQKIVIDIRGQVVTPATEAAIRKAIVDKSGGALGPSSIIFRRK